MQGVCNNVARAALCSSIGIAGAGAGAGAGVRLWARPWTAAAAAGLVVPQEMQMQIRGLRVKVFDGDIEMAVRNLQRKLVGSGMEKLIRRAPKYHIKPSQKRVMLKKRRDALLHAHLLSNNLKTILSNKVRGL